METLTPPFPPRLTFPLSKHHIIMENKARSECNLRNKELVSSQAHWELCWLVWELCKTKREETIRHNAKALLRDFAPERLFVRHVYLMKSGHLLSPSGPGRSLVRFCPLLGRPVSSTSLIRSQIKSLSRTKECSEQTLSKGQAFAEVGSEVKTREQRGLGLAVIVFGSQKSRNTEFSIS